MSACPSFYRLDRFAAQGRPASDLAGHVAGCARCQGHLATVSATPAEPPWLGSAPPERRRVRSVRVWLGLGAVPLAAALALVLVRPAPAPTPNLLPVATLNEKGAPVVSAFIKRGESVNPWDGQSPLRPGDRLRLRVQGAGGQFASVASLPERGAPAVLWSGRLESGATTYLPPSFRVDAEAGHETLEILVGPRPPAPAEHARAQPSPEVWQHRITFMKEATP